MSSYLDKTGLTYLWGKIKAKIPTKTSDLTNDSGFITSASANVPYLLCSTAAGTAAKTTTIVSGSFDSSDLVTGAQIVVEFTNTNTIANPTLSVNGTAAKSIKRYGTTAVGTANTSSWMAGSIVRFIYDGNYWVIESWLNTTYSSMTVAEIDAGTATSAKLITPARLKHAVETWSSGGSEWTELTTMTYNLASPIQSSSGTKYTTHILTTSNDDLLSNSIMEMIEPYTFARIRLKSFSLTYRTYGVADYSDRCVRLRLNRYNNTDVGDLIVYLDGVNMILDGADHTVTTSYEFKYFTMINALSGYWVSFRKGLTTNGTEALYKIISSPASYQNLSLVLNLTYGVVSAINVVLAVDVK